MRPAVVPWQHDEQAQHPPPTTALAGQRAVPRASRGRRSRRKRSGPRGLSPRVRMVRSRACSREAGPIGYSRDNQLGNLPRLPRAPGGSGRSGCRRATSSYNQAKRWTRAGISGRPVCGRRLDGSRRPIGPEGLSRILRWSDPPGASWPSNEPGPGQRAGIELPDDHICAILGWKHRTLDYDESARTKSAGVCPVQRRNALVKALGSENPKRKATSSIPRFSFVK